MRLGPLGSDRLITHPVSHRISISSAARAWKELATITARVPDHTISIRRGTVSVGAPANLLAARILGLLEGARNLATDLRVERTWSSRGSTVGRRDHPRVLV
jgi:hypothetical protein